MYTADVAHREALLAHTEWVRQLALRLVRDPELADDLTQETYLAALDGPAQPVRSQRAWLAGVLRNQLWVRLRGEGRRRARERRVAADGATPSTLEVVERAARHRQVVEVVMELPEHYREVLLLRYFDGRTPTEIARERGEPIATVKTRLQRALALMRQRLDRSAGSRGAWIGLLAPLLREPIRAVPRWPGWFGGSGRIALGLGGLALAAGAVALAWLAPWRGRAVPALAGDRLAAAVPAARAPAATGDATARRQMPLGSAAVVQRRAVERAELDPRARRVHGDVVDLEGRPLPGVVVRHVARRRGDWAPRSGEGTRIAVAGARGQFVLRDVPAGGSIEVASDSHTAVLVGQPRSRDDGARVTVVAAPRLRLAGNVVDDRGAPLSDALVAIHPAPGLRARGGHTFARSSARRFAAVTDDDGAFALPRAPALAGGQLVVTREGFDTMRTAAPASSDATMALRLRRAVPSAAALRGVVLNSTGAPAVDARVADGSSITRTDANGAFSLDVRDGASSRRILALVPGHQPAELRLAAARPVGSDPVVLRLGPPPRQLRGTVHDRAGAPVRGARVWITDPTVLCHREPPAGEDIETCGRVYGDADREDLPVVVESYLAGEPLRLWRPVRTNAQGGFVLDGLLDRPYTVVVMGAGGGAMSRHLGVRPGGEEVRFTIDERPGEVLRGRVVAAADGAPVGGVDIGVQRRCFELTRDGARSYSSLDLGPWQRTAPDGSFALAWVRGEGDVALRVEGPDVLTTIVPMPATGATQSGFRIEVVRRVELCVSVEFARGADALRLLDRGGNPVGAHRAEGDVRRTMRDLPIVDGCTGWFAAPDTAVTAVLLRDGDELQRHDVVLRSGHRHDLRF
ncbi:MAG: sigma-70 family RNA polymerase sigma factor [Planctomycetota bacterium]